MLDRRQFLAASTLAAATSTQLATAAEAAKTVAFFLVSDTHYLAQKETPEAMRDDSVEVTGRLIGLLNELPGKRIEESAGGGTILAPRGVLHAGDIIDTGDKSGGAHEKMQATEWAAFVSDFGLSGKEGKLRYPVYEVHGNHDGPQGRGIAVDGIRDRNKSRAGLKAVSKNGLHYSWDWGPVHFVCLGIVVGRSSNQPRKRRYDPHDSLAFLIEDLEAHVGRSSRPVVLMHHVDVARYASACDPAEPFSSKEWDPCDVADYYAAIAPYNIGAIFYGHTHGRQLHSWDGKTLKANRGIGVFNCDNSATFKDKNQAIFYVEITDRELAVRELKTTDRWQSFAWTPEVWRRPLA